MSGAPHKRQLALVDGTPEKRIFLSIISDYDLKTGLFELVDNALDLWVEHGKKSKTRIDLTLDADRQIISVGDNAGGVKEEQLRLLISPGASRGRPDHELIGIFGVGGKRAAVALGEHVEITTRHKKQKSTQIDITAAWLKEDSWSLAAYEIPDIPPGTTTVEISKLRQSFSDADVGKIRKSVGETYSWFLDAGCEIFLNNERIAPLRFES